MEGRFLGRDIIERPSCPFCGMGVDRPKELATRMPNEMPVGKCTCGAVYAFDTTGHNLGIAMIDALVFGCDGDWDLAWGLLPEEDYQEKMVENYDIESHYVVPGGAYEGRRIAGALYFIRLHRDVREVTQEGVDRRMRKATPLPCEGPSPKMGRKRFSKKEVEALVRVYRMDTLTNLALADKRIIRDLTRLLYAVDRHFRWRAADALGRVCAVIAKDDPGAVSKLMQGLFTSLKDTAASSWGSLDAIGEIVRNAPMQFGGYVPQLYQLSGDRVLLPQLVRAICRIAEKSPELIRKTAYQYIAFLKDPDAEIRGYAAAILGDIGAHEARDDVQRLVDDPDTIEYYTDGDVDERTVGRLALNALDKMA
ncbi:MAG: PBS lyase [Deltaproteobacteria bacterium]|nr:PBS lyase [Deltaproteobacteria bacterium]